MTTIRITCSRCGDRTVPPSRVSLLYTGSACFGSAICPCGTPWLLRLSDDSRQKMEQVGCKPIFPARDELNGPPFNENDCINASIDLSDDEALARELGML